jgi:serine/threonine protein phosphatase PrpC
MITLNLTTVGSGLYSSLSAIPIVGRIIKIALATIRPYFYTTKDILRRISPIDLNLKIEAAVTQTRIFTRKTPQEQMKIESELCQKAGETEHPRVELLNLEAAFQKGISIGLHSCSPSPYVSTYHGHGGATYMQDRAFTGMIEGFSEKDTLEYFAILDGHGEDGDVVAEFIKNHFSEYLRKSLPSKKINDLSSAEVKLVIENTFQALNEQLQYNPEVNHSGTTASIAFKIGDKLYVANVGDSRIILMTKEGDLIHCTEDGSVEPNRFTEEVIRKAAPDGLKPEQVFSLEKERLIRPDGSYGLNMVSTMGSFLYPYAIRVPKISGPYTITPGLRILGASDGVFTLLTSKQVHDLCKDKPTHEIPYFLGNLSKGIAYYYYSKKTWCVDNVSVLAADLIP